MKRTLGLVALAIALTGCASTGSRTPPATEPEPGSPSAFGVDTSGIGPTASVATSAPAAAPSAEPSSGPCTTHACIAADMDKYMVGLTAADESVSVKAKCYKKTVVYHQAADDYSATCLITFSDGSQATGTGNWLASQGKVTFTPAGT